MLLASSVANIACGNAGLGLVHGLNKGITYLFHTGRYASVSYGDLHAVLLPWVIAFNIPAAPARFATLARLMGVTGDGSDEEIANAGTERLKSWLADLDAPRRLPWDDCPPDDLDLIVNDVLGRQMANDNPRESSADDLRTIVLQSIRLVSVGADAPVPAGRRHRQPSPGRTRIGVMESVADYPPGLQRSSRARRARP